MRPEVKETSESDRINHLKPKDRQALEEFVRLIREADGDRVREIRLFGSKARGDDSPDSDIDVLIVVNQRDIELDNHILDAAFEVGLAFEVLLAPVVYTHEEYYDPLARKTLFFENTQREAIPL